MSGSAVNCLVYRGRDGIDSYGVIAVVAMTYEEDTPRRLYLGGWEGFAAGILDGGDDSVRACVYAGMQSAIDGKL
ncbi:MAG: hypothetical protein ACLRSW_13555 [Christensenellaceae bacterium]